MQQAAIEEAVVGPLIVEAFHEALRRAPELHQTWITLSLNLGSKLPDSLLMLSIQQCGQLDLVIRSMEREQVAIQSTPDAPSENQHFALSYLMLLSGVWLGLIYEVVRLLNERRLVAETADFQLLAHHLRLIRVPLEKHEIAADRRLTEEGLQMVRVPANGDESDYSRYEKSDPSKAHIMPSAISHEGSVMWHVIDLHNEQSFWLERRELSERILRLFAPAKT